jgi:hypothetical protein
MGLQVFRIEDDGTTTEIESDGPVKDVLETDQCYVIVSDEQRKVYLWKGITSSVRSKFIGAKRSQEIRGQVGMHYSVVPLDEGEEEKEFLDLIGGKTEAGIAQEIKAEDLDRKASGGHPLREKSNFDAPEPASGMDVGGSKSRRSQNTGPLYTGAESMGSMTQDTQQVNFEKIMQKLEEIKMPEGFERELIIIGNHAYSVVEKTQTFLGEKQVEKAIERVGSIPEGVFFAENYSPRILSESGRIIAIEFLRHKVNGKTESKAKSTDKKKLLKDQIKSQLEKK